MAVWYCQEVVAGRVPACIEEIQGCERFLAMREDALSGKAPFVWSDAHLVDFCDFFEKLPHTKGFEGSFVIEPVQCWWAAGIFAFRERETGLRWTRKASFWVPRKNAKTQFGVAVLLFCTNCEGEVGAEGVISAGAEKQAQVPYGTMRKMLEAEPDLKEAFGVDRETRDVTEFSHTGGSIHVVASLGPHLDGLNPHVILEEELHAQKIDVINVLESAQASRSNPLVITISTAGRDINAPAYDDWKTCQAVLAGRLRAPRLFTAMYAGDKEAEETKFDLETVERLNPLFGVSLNPVGLEEEAQKARQSEERLNEYRRTRLNIWARAAGNLISIDDWKACADPRLDLELFRGFPMYVGIDLASHSDLNAAAFVVMVDGCLHAVVKYWLPEQSPRFADDRYADSFAAWSRDGHLNLTEGNYADQDEILDLVLKTMEGHSVLAVGMDTYQHVFLAGALSKKGYPAIPVPKTAKYMSRPTDDLAARTKNPKLLQHDGNPVTEWCAGNVVGRRDENDNVLPKKEKRMTGASIDGMDALIIANCVRMHIEAGHVLGSDAPPPNPYLTRGLAGSEAA